VSRDYMDDPEEVLFMQVFVEEVGLWMDSFDAIKHVSFHHHRLEDETLADLF